MLPILSAQTAPNEGPKPSPTVQKMLDDAAKVKDSAQKIKALKKAIDAAKAANDVEGQAESFDALARAVPLGESVSWFESAIKEYSADGNGSGMGQAYLELGNSCLDLGRPTEALKNDNEGLSIARKLNDRNLELLALRNLGRAYFYLSQFDTALDVNTQALSMAKELGDKSTSAGILNNLGSDYDNLGQHEKALEYYNQAVSIGKEIGHPPTSALTNIGIYYAHHGQLAKALDYYHQSLAICRENSDRFAEALTHQHIGETQFSLRQYPAALEELNLALKMETEIGARRQTVYALQYIGNCYSALGQNEKALEYYNQSLSISQAVGARQTSAWTMQDIAGVLKFEKHLALAIVFAKQSVNTYQDLRREFRGLAKDLQDSYANRVEIGYRHLADLLIKQGRLGEAEKVMNLLKDSENFEFVARDAAFAGGVDGRVESVGAESGWWKEYQALQDRVLKTYSEEFDLTQKDSELRSSSSLTESQKAELAKTDAKLKELDAQKEILDKAADAYFDEVGKQASALSDSIGKEAEERVRQTGDELPSLLARMHRESGEKIGAVYAIASTDELNFLIVTYAGRSHLSVPVRSDDLNKMISDFRTRLMNPNADPRPEGQKLYSLVFEKLINQLQEAGLTRVVWCLDGTLRYVPIGALWDGKQYLIERGDYTMFDPLNLDRVALGATKNLEAAGFAATEGKGNLFAPLPGADKELKGVVKDDSEPGFTGAVPGRAFENQNFSEASLTTAMKGEQFSLLHIATHFNLGKDFNASHLLLGDGNLLSLKDFTAAGGHGRLGHLDLVCLSACDTAESFGDTVSAGSQFSSFVSLTLKDGASAVVASLWPVSDESTPLLMKQFYKYWMAHRDQGKAEALRQAQLALLHGEITGEVADRNRGGPSKAKGAAYVPYESDPAKPFAHPYFWAPFLLFGNWN